MSVNERSDSLISLKSKLKKDTDSRSRARPSWLRDVQLVRLYAVRRQNFRRTCRHHREKRRGAVAVG